MFSRMNGAGGGRGPRGRQGAAGLGASIVFRPGLPSSGVYVGTWAEVEARVNAASGDITVLVDSSNAPAVVPSTCDLDGNNMLVLGAASYEIGSQNTVLSFAPGGAGGRIRNLRAIIGPLLVECTPTVRPVFDYDPNTWLRIFIMRDGAQLALQPGSTISPISAQNPPLTFTPFELVMDFGARYYDSGLGIPMVSLTSPMSAGSSMILLIANSFDPSAFTPNLIGGDLSNTLIYLGDATAPRPGPNFLWPSFPAANIFTSRVDKQVNIEPSSGSTVDRPVDLMTGQMYFDTNLGKPVWWTGSQWVDATGAPA